MLFADMVMKKVILAGAGLVILCSAVSYLLAERHVFLGVLSAGIVVYAFFLASLAAFSFLGRKTSRITLMAYSYISFFGKLAVTALIAFVFYRLRFLDMYWFLVSFLIYFTVFLALEIILLHGKSRQKL
ncbi:MAG: hypothetical protein ACQEP5_09410 [Actinomycetota bacterium]